MEPLWPVAKNLVVPPIKLWFNWRLEGLDRIPEKGALLVAANHISYFDQFAYAHLLVERGRRPRFLAKSELFEVPLLGLALRGLRQIPVRRGTGDPTPVGQAVEFLARGECVVIFPEATVTRNPDFTPMRAKTGVARIVLGAHVPVVPMAVWGSQHIWQKAGRGSLKFGRPVWVEVGAPLDMTEYEDRGDDPHVLRAVTDRVMDEITTLVHHLRSRYPKRWA